MSVNNRSIAWLAGWNKLKRIDKTAITALLCRINERSTFQQLSRDDSFPATVWISFNSLPRVDFANKFYTHFKHILLFGRVRLACMYNGMQIISGIQGSFCWPTNRQRHTLYHTFSSQSQEHSRSLIHPPHEYQLVQSQLQTELQTNLNSRRLPPPLNARTSKDPGYRPSEHTSRPGHCLDLELWKSYSSFTIEID